MNDDLIKVGQRYDQRPSVFELIVSDHVPHINPLSYGLTSKEYKQIDPARYFVTSGDAVEKAKILNKDMKCLANDVRRLCIEMLVKELSIDESKAIKEYSKGVRPSKPKRFREYDEDVHKAAVSAGKMLNALISAKGEDCFLETEWDGHRLLCIPKNPRGRK